MDLHDKLIALQRRNAGPVRRAERPTVTTNSCSGAPQQAVASTSRPPNPQQPAQHLSPPQPSRRQKHHPSNHLDSVDTYDRKQLSTSPGPSRPPPGRLYNPSVDPIPTQRPMQHREADGYSDVSSNAPAFNPSHRRPAQSTQQQPAPRQLFDPRRDDPVRFSVLTRASKPLPPPPGPPSGGYVSASSTSMSDVQSIGSNFTLTSGTTSSSASNPHSPASNQESGGAAFLQQFKKVYRQISDLETQVKNEVQAADVDMDGVKVHTANGAVDKWAARIQLHKTLAEADHRLLTLAMRPQVPNSLQSIPLKYNIPMRLWNNAFQLLLQSLRIASATSHVAYEHLTGFIFYAYGFYTTLLEEENLSSFRNSWIEALGDLARYQMTVAATSMSLTPTPSHIANAQHLAISEPKLPLSTRNGDSPLPSIGAHAAAELEVDDDRELWRKVARDWYARGLKDIPGIGRLHHHLGLLSRDVPGEELQATYHFIKGLLASHALDLARESILPLFSLAQQSARYQPSSPAPSIFLLMQGMLITRVQLDDFQSTLARFFERLRLEPESVSESEWVMMAILNIGAVLEYGRPEGVIRKLGGLGPVASAKSRSIDKILDRTARGEKSHRDAGPDGMDGVVVTNMDPSAQDNDKIMADGEVQEPEDDRGDVAAAMEALSTNPSPSFNTNELPYTLRLALQLMFDTLSYVLKTPNIPSKSPFRPASLNPYITITLTFLTTLLRHEPTAAVFERSVPWNQLAQFLSQVYRQGQGSSEDASKVPPRLISSSPLPEDWCMRGMEWVGRRVYERGFWRPSKSQGGIQGEMDVILPSQQPVDVVDGIVEDDDGDADSIPLDWNSKRWKRLRWCADGLVRAVHGLNIAGEGRSRTLQVGGLLQQKVEIWRIERQREEEAEARRRDRLRFREMDVDMDVDEVFDDEEDEDDENDSPEVLALKARRRYLWSLQRAASGRPRTSRTKPSRRSRPERPAIQAVPGYTILVCDTNVLLSSLPIVETLIASERWTAVLPLAVVTELDGLSHNNNELGKAARDALNYLITAVKTQSVSLKIQTSRGNYLSSLSIRSEETSLGHGGNFDRNMDDLILRTAIWQADHFVDRSSFLKGNTKSVHRTDKTSKVVLLSFDRNLRLKARARELDAADERDMVAILATS